MTTEVPLEVLRATLDDLAGEVLGEAGVHSPPVDAFALAAALGLTVAHDKRQTCRARFVRLRGGGASILVRSEPRRERLHWAIAHEIGELRVRHVFERLSIHAREVDDTMRERLANQLANCLLLPGTWFERDALEVDWDLLALKARYTTASHELIARRMLDVPSPVIITIFDHNQLTWRQGNRSDGFPGLTALEQTCWRHASATGVPQSEVTSSAKVTAWPIHETGWRRDALDYARKHHHDVLIVDTAGRLAIDEAMMQEIRRLHELLHPVETLFVVDAMQGQDAVNVAKVFSETLPLTGVILTKLDGDARGGAALSVRQVTGRPIKFVGVSEKLSGLEPFYPERLSARILGMGDVLALVEEARRNVDLDEAEKLAKKVKSGKGFDLDDFRNQMRQMKKMGGLNALIDKLPAQLAQAAQGGVVDDRVIGRTVGIIDSMTPQERARPEIIKASRKRRIATGSGVTVQEVNRLLNQFEQMQKMMRMMGKGGLQKMMRSVKGGFPGLR